MELQTFNNSQFGELRTAEIDSKIYYCGLDVAKSLGYAKPNNAINQHCKGALKQGTPTNGGIQELTFIPEGDVYRLVARSKLPQAEKFESWVFDDVLPQIAHTGQYQKIMSPMELMELQYKALKEVDEKVIDVDCRVTNIEENSRLDPGQYNYLVKLISSRIKAVKTAYELEFTKKQNGELFHGINKEVKEITGVRTRSDLRQKDFEKVCSFVEEWNPSSATMQKIKDLGVSDV